MSSSTTTVHLYSPLKRILLDVLFSRNADLRESTIEIQSPRDPAHGDFALPCFQFSKQLQSSPTQLAQEFAEYCTKEHSNAIKAAQAIGPYCNITFSPTSILQAVETTGSIKESDHDTILIESPGPNTNKPLHLGHVRNVILGDSLKRVLAFQGHDVHSIDIVNDRGVHICKSMLAWIKEGNSETPEDVGKKPDHYVGDWYVRYAQMEKENPEIAEEAQALLRKREAGDEETLRVWKLMRDWALTGIRETCDSFGIEIEKAYFESDHYLKGKAIVEQGLQEGVFERNEKGHIVYQSPKYGPKVVLRSDGTTTYMTQDIGLGKVRADDRNMDRMIYVVGNEQDQHFALLFEIFQALGYSFADQCYHLSYGYISLPDGKMKSREGNVVDADTLYDTITAQALANVQERYTDISEQEAYTRAQRIAMAAIKFFIIKYDAKKDFVFDREQSLRFDGETGPYVLYTYARGRSILRGYEGDTSNLTISHDLLDTDLTAHQLAILVGQFTETVARAASLYQPYLVARYCVDLASLFNTWYHNTKVLDLSDPSVTQSRLALVDRVSSTIKEGLGLLGIETIEVM